MRSTASIALLAVLSCAAPRDDTAHVTHVYDGDTIEIEWEEGKDRLRYIGIDTPEWDDDRESVRRLAAEATEANRRLVSGRTVRIEFDQERRDRYGRLLAYVIVGDTLVNEWLVRNGFGEARSYPPNLRHQRRLDSAERIAREQSLRLWDGRLAGRPLR